MVASDQFEMKDKAFPSSIYFVSFGDHNSTLSLRARCLSRSLRSKGWKSRVIINRNATDQNFDHGNVEYIGTGVGNLISAVGRYYRRDNASMFHFLNPGLKAFLCKSAFPGLRLVGDWEDWHCKGNYRGMKRVVSHVLDSHLRRKCAKIVVCSEWLKFEFQNLGHRDVGYVPYGIELEGLPDLPNVYDVPTAVFMGSFSHNWDHDILLNALLLLKERNEHPHVCMIGKGDEWQKWWDFKMKHSLDNLAMPGFLPQDEMMASLKSAHCLLFPIRSKVTNLARCPYKVFQYALAGRPVITCRVGEVPKVLGDKGLYVEATPEAFAGALSTIMRQARAKNIDYRLDKQSWDNRAEALALFLRSL